MVRHSFVIGFLAVALASSAAAAQQRIPSPSEAQALMQSRPDLANQVRQQITQSGMTPDQIRARLRAEGYPESFLDGLLPGGNAQGVNVTDDMIAAIGRLGIASSDDAAMLRTMLRSGDSLSTTRRIELPRVSDDSVRGPGADSLAYRLFGLETFRNATSEFMPVLDGPVDENYRLGPGDQLVLILTGDAELAHTLDVTREGFVMIPQVGQLSVANLTIGQLENLLYARLPRSYAGVRRGADAPTKFSISVSRLRAIQVFVTGEVERPASYRISSASTAMTALYAAGGPTSNGSLRRVEVRRAGKVIGALDTYDYLVRGDNAKDVRLENGDIVFVTTHGPRVRVMGEIMRPATYELLPGETLTDVIGVAGGLRPTASGLRLRIARIVPAAERSGAGQVRQVVDVAANAGALPAIPMVAGDEVTVLPIAERVRNRVVVRGHVWSPGAQGLRPGMTLGEALRAAGGPKPDVYLGQVSVTRLRADSTRMALRAMLRDSTGAVVNDFALQEDDEITVFSLTEFRPPRFVAIGGSVRRGGQYRWREGMTLRDLVLEAGGLREGAYLREAEVARIPEARNGRTTAQTIRVPLDSSYLADYAPGRPYIAPRGETAAGFRSAPEVPLLPYDNVLIMQQPDWLTPRSVVLSGEVRFPGRYTLVSKDERLSDVIRRAGGLTADAAVDAAYFARAVALTSFRADTSKLRRDSLALGSLVPDTVERARVGLDLAQALRERNSSDNLVLFDDDSLHVPVQRSTIEIRGAVNAPTSITAQGGARLSFYVRAAGGASLVGDERKAYVIQPNGQIQARRRILLVPVDPKPRPGATVVVPARSTENRASERIAMVSVIAQTVASLATVYAILR
ncbi:SLBB domain-containing protein [Pseudogemmatithrix spongiicola]|uniref:SLBB domain-containing protein n=1 Tax=Pseudogemmatithrix spongiicola TaxID=3062599 RepID=A0AA49JUZ1_9BACT|nr:SLBB domain-containing protein [Gemmatimonadaceae bacterium 'strain 138']WKW15363.1 SLBB domain-containing protein [Gemmatimonadaceae bacterium 'strain 318']